MYDSYSLIKLQSRPAAEGEELISHRFRDGLIGMVARSDFERWRSSEERAAIKASAKLAVPPPGPWASIKKFFTDFLTFYGFIDPNALASHDDPWPVVGIPSEALVRVFGISPEWQQRYNLGSFEDALFIEAEPSDPVKNALCFGSGVTMRVQLLHEGQRIKVLRRSWAESLEPNPELVHERA